MQFNDTTNKNGLIQVFERLTRMPDGTVAGTLLKQVTAQINEAFEDILPFLLAFNDQIRWDDTNHTDAPIGYVNIVSGQADYKITQDDNSLDILNMVGVRILQSTTATEYVALERMLPDDERAADAMSPNPSITGVPTHFLEMNNTLYFYPEPNYAKTSGIELFFQRQQDYFESTDTTQTPGIPKPFHKLLVIIAALEWTLVNRSKDGNLITRLEDMRDKKIKDLKTMIALRNPSKVRMTMKPILYI